MLIRVAMTGFLALAMILMNFGHNDTIFNRVANGSQGVLAYVNQRSEADVVLFILMANVFERNDKISECNIDYLWEERGMSPPIKKISMVGNEYVFDYHWKERGISPPIKKISMVNNEYVFDYHREERGISPPIKEITMFGNEYVFDYHWEERGISPPAKSIFIK